MRAKPNKNKQTVDLFGRFCDVEVTEAKYENKDFVYVFSLYERIQWDHLYLHEPNSKCFHVYSMLSFSFDSFVVHITLCTFKM